MEKNSRLWKERKISVTKAFDSGCDLIYSLADGSRRSPSGQKSTNGIGGNWV